MSQRETEHSGLRSAVNAARAARAVARIVRAAATAGLPGAAAAAAKETLPFLGKVILAILAALLLTPMVVCAAIPNLFFGYQNSEAQPVMDMTEQAMMIGSACLNLEDFEKTQIDAVVTSLISEYEEEEISIGEVEIEHAFREEDLIWMIAINSVAHRQDLGTMSAADIRELCVSSVLWEPSLFPAGDDGRAETLSVKFKRMDPEVMMERLGFDEEAKTWSGALYEVLSESGALEKYAPYYEAYRPDYGGDGSYTGEIQYGDSYSNAIDTSGFQDPDSKNNLDLAAYATQAWRNRWGYVWGTYGNVLTPSLLAYKLQQYPEGVGNYETFIRENWLGRRTADCIGLIKGYGWLDPETLSIRYGANGMPDYGANQMYQAAKDSGNDCGGMDTMPEIVGLGLWKNGHAGIYVGNGYAIEAMGTRYGVVRTRVEDRGWQAWYKIPSIRYLDD